MSIYREDTSGVMHALLDNSTQEARGILDRMPLPDLHAANGHLALLRLLIEEANEKRAR